MSHPPTDAYDLGRLLANLEYTCHRTQALRALRKRFARSQVFLQVLEAAADVQHATFLRGAIWKKAAATEKAAREPESLEAQKALGAALAEFSLLSPLPQRQAFRSVCHFTSSHTPQQQIARLEGALDNSLMAKGTLSHHLAQLSLHRLRASIGDIAPDTFKQIGRYIYYVSDLEDHPASHTLAELSSSLNHARGDKDNLAIIEGASHTGLNNLPLRAAVLLAYTRLRIQVQGSTPALQNQLAEYERFSQSIQSSYDTTLTDFLAALKTFQPAPPAAVEPVPTS